MTDALKDWLNSYRPCRVYGSYGGSVVVLAQFPTEAQAREFMENDYILIHADEIENGEEDVIITADGMWCDADYAEPLNRSLCIEANEMTLDDLPF